MHQRKNATKPCAPAGPGRIWNSACRLHRAKSMWVAVLLILALATLPIQAAGATSWPEPGHVLGFPWGTSLENVRQELPGGELGKETTATRVYVMTSRIEGIPVILVFQFVLDAGLQGVRVRFPAEQMGRMVAMFERQYGLAPIRGNRQWKWEGPRVRISLGDYPHFRTRGWKGTAWLRTTTWEAALADADEEMALARARPATATAARSSYEKRVLNKIYSELHYPPTMPGMYAVFVAFDLTPTGHPRQVRLAVDPPNRDVAESVRAAVHRAEPFPLPPVQPGAADRRINLSLTVTIFR